MDQPLETLAEYASEAHARIQRDFAACDPVVGVSRQMRAQGFPADVITLDCIKSGKRIILILHDQQPDIVSYQFARRDAEAGDGFDTLPFAQLDADTLYRWMRDYLAGAG
ncbi:hypothetical protein [Motiliproteus sediminis]|uniref:hypothetical protein n=1 Tax=Motiliproteus sediminis TaxID=1468178 RepID=UPI001AF00972|nr:hypothetical protein [Motiliproteus sediminis]